jgi:hypothetical protein
MAYGVGCSFQPKVQIVRTTAHAPFSSIRRVDSVRSPSSTMRIVCLVLSPFLLPRHKQFHISRFCMGAPRSDPDERAYYSPPSSEATSTHELLDSPEAERLYIDQGEIVRERVERDEFRDDDPGPPKATEGVSHQRTGTGSLFTIHGDSKSPAFLCARLKL